MNKNPVRDILAACCLALWCLGVGVISVSSEQREQTYDSLEIQRLRMAIEDNSRRIGRLEELKDAGARIAVLEDNMFEIKWLSRSVAAALVVQLFLNGISIGRRRIGDS